MLNEKNSKGETPLFWAAKEGRLELVQLLLRKGADPTIGDSALSTPLHQAAKGGHIEIADLLIAAGAHLEATTQNKGT